jgi:hypothetical protein
MRSQGDVDLSLSLLAAGRNPTEVARITGIPRETIREWSHGRHLVHERIADAHSPCKLDHLSQLDHEAYRYLFGIYLGDGCLSQYPRGVWRLRLTMDARYAGIIAECAEAVEIVSGKRAHLLQRRPARCIEVSAYWKHWLCLFPQHGPGRKHLRPISLTEWQQDIVMADPRRFLRGLVHSDGCRIIATERKGRYVRRAPRYAFKNRSGDILRLFGAACEVVGVHFTRSSDTQISVYSRAAVARLDEFIGPKQ